MLNRVLRWEPSGIIYKPDQRHAEMAVRELRLEAAGSVLTPGTRVEHDAASAPSGVLSIKTEDESELMEPPDATHFRCFAAGCICLVRDGVDLQYSCEEAGRRMQRPRCSD